MEGSADPLKKRQAISERMRSVLGRAASRLEEAEDVQVAVNHPSMGTVAPTSTRSPGLGIV